MSDEFLPIGQSTNYKKFTNAGSSWIAEEVLVSKTAFSQANLAPTTSQAYAAGDVIGGSVTFSSVFRSTSLMSGVLQSITVADKTTMQSAIDFLFFHTATTGSTFTNDAAVTVADGDLGKLIGHVSVLSNDYASFADNSLGTTKNIGLAIRATTGTGLLAVPVNRSTQPTYVSTGDLIVTLGVLQD